MSEIVAEGKKNLPGEVELAKIQRYIEQTPINKKHQDICALNAEEMGALLNFSGATDINRAFWAISLAFNYGKAKSYRAAKAEARK